MHTVNINGNEIYYSKKEDPHNAREDYKNVFTVTEFMCKQLKIPCPDIAIVYKLNCIDYKANEYLGAYLYTTQDIPALKNNLILFNVSSPGENDFRLTGTFAHEMRHIWQYKYHPTMNTSHANGFMESLTHPGEIDADGYAIYYLAKATGISMNDAADIMCPEERKNYPEAYTKRLEKAKEIACLLATDSCHSERKKMSFFEKIKKHLYGGKHE